MGSFGVIQHFQPGIINPGVKGDKWASAAFSADPAWQSEVKVCVLQRPRCDRRDSIPTGVPAWWSHPPKKPFCCESATDSGPRFFVAVASAVFSFQQTV